ncbi:hypothetical protein LCGC14_2028420 [marine sediment metagenome]|uniref:Peptidase M15C domain-containing protein n=1 Tax=marine sediment metagenome TaxID=412755 RepID=A0A0F9H8T9_9ZZZZ
MKTPTQALFAHKIARLILYIESEGYHVTFGDAFASTGHSRESKHYERLAIDLNLFDAEWNWMQKTSDHQKFGEYWESLGGTWGGRFKRKDGNHYSWGER